MARILVVDDEEAIRVLLSRFLQRAQHDVVVASNGEEAMVALRESSVDLVITDVNMPEMNGIEVLLQLRKTRPSLPIVVMSGGGRLDKQMLLDTALTLSATAVIAKPIDFAALLVTIDGLVPAPRP